MEKYIKYKIKYLKLLKQNGGKDTKSLEEYAKDDLIEKYDENKHFVRRKENGRNRLKCSFANFDKNEGFNDLYLKEDYNQNNIIAVFKTIGTPYRNEYGFNVKLTTRQDIIIEQYERDSCSITTIYMIAQSKKINIPEKFITQCYSVKNIRSEYGSEIKLCLEKMIDNLQKKLIIKFNPSFDDIKHYLDKYGTIGYQSNDHIKVIDDYIQHDKNTYYIIRDPIYFYQFVYDLEKYINKIDYIFTIE
jgi:hypothetical protein